MLHRIDPGHQTETVLWVVLPAIIASTAVVVARRARDGVVALLGISLAGLLVSPVSSRNVVRAGVPGIGIRGAKRTRVALAALVMFRVQPFIWLPNTGDQEKLWSWWQYVPGDPHVWIGAATPRFSPPP